MNDILREEDFTQGLLTSQNINTFVGNQKLGASTILLLSSKSKEERVKPCSAIFFLRYQLHLQSEKITSYPRRCFLWSCKEKKNEGKKGRALRKGANAVRKLLERAGSVIRRWCRQTQVLHQDLNTGTRKGKEGKGREGKRAAHTRMCP
jgi:hypothetical protein